MSGFVQQAAHLVNSHRIFFYTLVSFVSVSAVIVNALKNYSNFYSVAIYLSKSSRSVLVCLAYLCEKQMLKSPTGPGEFWCASDYTVWPYRSTHILWVIEAK